MHTRERSSGSPLLAAIGPGIVFAGAAIGVSHLVQATRAGAVYGLGLLVAVVAAHVMKFPALLFGPRYAAATGTSLLQGYRRQGWHALGVFALITAGTMFTIQAAVTIVTASVVKHVIAEPVAGAMGFAGPPLGAVAAGLLVVCALLLALGGYRWLDAAIKVLMVIMASTTVFAAAIEFGSVKITPGSLLPVIPAEPEARLALLGFVVVLVGWMPAPLDISVWNSLWTLARRRQTGHTPTKRQCHADFGIGYTLCIVLAVAFVVLGAGELHDRGIAPEPGGSAFAAQLIDLYSASIGAWVRPVIAACAVAVMFSTTLTVFDALPRTLLALTDRMRTDEDPGAGKKPEASTRPGYWIAMFIIGTGAMVLITALSSKMRPLVDLATTLSFLGTPIIAWFNHRAITSRGVPEADRPGRFMVFWSLLGIIFWTAFTGVFLWSRFFQA